MSLSSLHRLVRLGDLDGVRTMLAGGADVNAYDRRGRSPLMAAMQSAAATPELCALLLEHGADVHQLTLHDPMRSTAELHVPESVISIALSAGVPWKVRMLLQHGADIHYQRSGGYNALIDAVHGRNILENNDLPDLLRLLAREGVNLDVVTEYGDSGCSVLSGAGRFDAVRAMLDAGADAAPLKWTPLMRAVALGTLAEVAAEIARPAPGQLEARDGWDRTVWVLAVQTGDVAKARLILGHGADPLSRSRCETPAVFHAIRACQIPMLKWLLEIGVSLTDRDRIGMTALMTAASHQCLEAVVLLLDAGAEIDAYYFIEPPGEVRSHVTCLITSHGEGGRGEGRRGWRCDGIGLCAHAGNRFGPARKGGRSPTASLPASISKP